MPIDNKVKWKCPRCRAKEAFDVPFYFEVTQDPQLLQQLLSGELFLHRCGKCGAVNENGASLMVANIGRKYIFALGRSVIDDTKDSVLQLIRNNGLESRLVLSSSGLIEKVRIAEAGLNDVAVELMKFFIRRLKRLGLKPNDRLVFTGYVMDAASGKGSVSFDVPGGRVVSSYSVSYEFYMQLRPLLMLKELKPATFETVNTAWINRKMSLLVDRYAGYYDGLALKLDSGFTNAE